MLILLLLAAAGYGGLRLGRAVLRTLDGVPRRNRDMVFF